jgi:hypothetical protein
MTDRARPGMTEDELDPGAYIGQEPELASETIPGGVRPDDERVAFNASQRAVDGEPGTDRPPDPPDAREAGQDR